jgi:L-threonylcarbamoyladenylate synthase
LQAAEALAAGGLVILPTETVYGLAADAVQAEAIAVFDDRARALAEAFWPGPLTLVAPVRDRAAVCDLARAGLDSVAVRVPGHVRARAVIALFGKPVVAPSANRSGRPSPTTFEDAVEETGFAAADAVDGGPCAVGVESTVVSVLDGRVALLRPGSVTRDEIEAVVGPLDTGGEGHRSPGRTALHYAPDAPVRINADAAREGEILLGFGSGVGETRWSLSPSGDLREAAANLFRRLRVADREKPAGIAVSPIPPHGLGEAINDRLKRAAGFVG